MSNLPHDPAGFVPPGHFYSPIPDWQRLRAEANRIYASPPRTIPGIDMRDEAQLALVRELARYYPEMPFRDRATDGLRYRFENNAFADCDAIFLYGMIRKLQPRLIVEVGSGWSSCVSLDTIERFLDGAVSLTCIEPYPQGLRSLLKPDDEGHRVQIVEQRLQDVELGVFEQLGCNDILFVDSTHVSRTDSDVNRIVFEILPRLAAGVVVHFHDMFWPFEYPRAWMEAGMAWNELYLLRAFLQFNTAFEVLLMSSYLATFHSEAVRARMPLAMRNSGGNLWLVRR